MRRMDGWVEAWQLQGGGGAEAEGLGQTEAGHLGRAGEKPCDGQVGGSGRQPLTFTRCPDQSDNRKFQSL